MIATIVDTGTLGKVVLYSLIAGVGITVVFGAGVSGAAGLLEAARDRRLGAMVAWATLTVSCGVVTLGAVVFGIVLMTQK